MSRQPPIGRLARWTAWFRSSGPRDNQTQRRGKEGGSRSLRMESLEHRALLSVNPVVPETFQTFKFDVLGSTYSDFMSGDYHVTINGYGDAHHPVLKDVTIAYDSLDHGVIANKSGTLKDEGRWNATKGRTTYRGTYKLDGVTRRIVDNGGVLKGSVQVTSTSTTPNAGFDFNGTYDLTNASFDTSDFSFKWDRVGENGYRLSFNNGKIVPKTAFDVDVKPSWNADGTVNVVVKVAGPHKTADRHAPVTKVRLYWSRGTTLLAALPDSIPVYWNEARGRYTVNLTGDCASPPAGATDLAFVTKFDNQTRIKTLALPTVSIGAASVAEGNSSLPGSYSQAVFPVALSQAFPKDVTVAYSTVKGRGTGGAMPGVDYGSPASKKEVAGSIVIARGSLSGEIRVPIIGDTTYELDKTFTVRLDPAKSLNARVSPDRNKMQAVGTIVNDDPLPWISISDATVAEGNSGTTALTFTVTLSNPSYQKISVRYATADGTGATAAKTGDRDYLRKTGILTFNPGAPLTNTITVLVNGDTKVELDETLFVNLTLPKGLVDPVKSVIRGMGTITNDDLAPASRKAGSRNAAIAEFAGPAELASYFDHFARNEEDKDTLLEA